MNPKPLNPNPLIRLLARPSARLALAAVLLGAAWATYAPAGLAQEAAVAIPPPADDRAVAGDAGSDTAVVAGGCFWGVQGVFQHVKGVSSAVSGYAGGEPASAHYEVVGSGRTGHAESVRITYDPRQISYGRLLQIYFSVAHDPTQLNRQGPDWGTQYRSAIFPQSAAQAQVAKSYIDQLNQANTFGKPLATQVELQKNFYPAEAYHQDYLTRHPDNPYIAINDLPKIDNLKKLFPDRYRAAPVLVNAGS